MADELVKLLNSFGYQPIFLQKTGVKPPDLYQFVDNRLIRRGPLKDYDPEFGKLEETRGTLASIQHRESSKKNLDAAVDFLQNALAALGITAIPKLSLSFAGDAELVFTFSEVSYIAIDPTKIDTILQALQVPLAIPDNYVTQGLLHIAYEYAYARRLLMSRADGKQFKTDISGKVGEFIDLGAQGEIDTDGAEPTATGWRHRSRRKVSPVMNTVARPVPSGWVRGSSHGLPIHAGRSRNPPPAEDARDWRSFARALDAELGEGRPARTPARTKGSRRPSGTRQRRRVVRR